MLLVMWAVMMFVALASGKRRGNGYRIRSISTKTPPSNLLTLTGKAIAVDLIPAVGSQAVPHGNGDGNRWALDLSRSGLGVDDGVDDGG
ncbi:hypothetical protein CI102_7277 [Trichoderma harzianum]|jgi:hypothetical protein|uniref:Secreted protein n=1 Tax=Trichoderma harzianum CBS 226.95 TaxID=983964 RepID=A0A2T3ZYN9_TRIHA|nr:hypothetical protein M431DRAFT_268993 [Trichoderma harzianum CBS 226.95]PKK47609.1 hypothetical protein CI102_7277 [Trichoderma harzianum]PTB49919.1 hypothetical protein M431DRAFT_268993 [Trichoderma harzianum CBS 226.95]